MKKTLLLPLIFILINCAPLPSSKRIVKFTNKPDEITTTQSLRDYLDKNPKPRIVLRTSGTAKKVTQTDNIYYLYDVIEGELLKSGFIVRDRQLFNKILADSDTYNDYESLKEKSNTDLIIELTNLDRDIKYQTNKYYNSRGKEKTSSIMDATFYGATIEFKIIMIGSNKFAGLYKFNYVPCVNGCVINKPNPYYKVDKSEPYEAVERNTLINFVENATQKLVDEMRQ